MKSKKSLPANLREEMIESLREKLDGKVALLDEYYKQIIELNTILDKNGFKPLGYLHRAEDCQSPPSGSFKELRDRVESVMEELERVRGELVKSQQGQREQTAVVSGLSDIIIAALHN